MLTNQFLTVSDSEASVHLLSDTAVAQLHAGLDIASKRDHGRSEPTARLTVYRTIFRSPVVLCFPVTEQGMMGLAENYTGPHEARVRYLAAALALGVPIESAGNGLDSDDPEGGIKAGLKPLPINPPSRDGIPMGHLL